MQHGTLPQGNSPSCASWGSLSSGAAPVLWDMAPCSLGCSSCSGASRQSLVYLCNLLPLLCKTSLKRLISNLIGFSPAPLHGHLPQPPLQAAAQGSWQETCPTQRAGGGLRLLKVPEQMRDTDLGYALSDSRRNLLLTQRPYGDYLRRMVYEKVP